MFIIFIVPVSVSASPNTAPDKTQDRITSLGHTKAKSEMYMSSRDWLKVSCIRFFFKGDEGISCKIYYTNRFFTSVFTATWFEVEKTVIL